METKSWRDSRAIKYLALTWLATTLVQLVPMLQSHQIDLWALGAQAVGTLAAILIRMAQPDVEAPISALNRGGPQ